MAFVFVGITLSSTEDRHQLIVGQSQRNATKCGPNNEEPQAVARCMGKDTYVPVYT